MTALDPMPIPLLLSDYGDSELRKIVRHVQRLVNMNKILSNHLPANLIPHCQIGQFNVTLLILLVDSAAWLMTLRYLKTDLLKKLKSEPSCIHLQDIQFRIQPLQKISPAIENPVEKRKISKENSHLLISTANEVVNPLLKKALLRLAENTG